MSGAARRAAACTLRALAGLLDPPPGVVERAIVADGIAQGRADLQLIHGHRGSVETTRTPSPVVDGLAAGAATVEHLAWGLRSALHRRRP